jgi:predicted MFS family arabinose efflux permease
VVVVAATQFVEVVALSALGPLLPSLRDQFGLSGSDAGAIVAAYAVGSLLGTIPAAMLASRLGVRTTLTCGLLTLATGSLLFALATGPLMLAGARAIQGLASAMSWTGAFAWLIAVAPRDRRAEVIGVAMSASVAGALGGPALGALAEQIGLAPAFLGLAAVAALYAGLIAAQPSAPPTTRQSFRSIGPALHEPALAFGLAFFGIASFLLGCLHVVGPLRLDAVGWTAVGIAGVSLGGAAFQVVASPLAGRWADRTGVPPILAAALGTALLASLLLAQPSLDGRWTLPILLVLAGGAIAVLYVPASALLSYGAERAGTEQAFGFALANLAWAPGAAAGALLAGWMTEHVGDLAIHAVAAGVCAIVLATVCLTRRRRWAAAGERV